jgi:hypothetical protein
MPPMLFDDLGGLIDVDIDRLVARRIGIGDIRGQKLLPIRPNPKHFLLKIMAGMTTLPD